MLTALMTSSELTPVRLPANVVNECMMGCDLSLVG